jgi:hypothetical protein
MPPTSQSSRRPPSGRRSPTGIRFLVVARPPGAHRAHPPAGGDGADDRAARRRWSRRGDVAVRGARGGARVRRAGARPARLRPDPSPVVTRNPYQDWVDCVVDLVRAVRAEDPRPLVLAGASMGGMLTRMVSTDPRGGGTWIPLGFLRTYLRSVPRSRTGGIHRLPRVAGSSRRRSMDTAFPEPGVLRSDRRTQAPGRAGRGGALPRRDAGHPPVGRRVRRDPRRAHLRPPIGRWVKSRRRAGR